MSELTQAQLKKVLHYCPDTGAFTWLKRDRSMFKNDRGFRIFNAKFPGKPAGGVHSRGYLHIGISNDNGKVSSYKAHRLAWLYIHGEFPEVIDHINGVKVDNRLVNIRNITQAVNTRNARIYKTSKTGILGVTWKPAYGKWKSEISVNKKRTHLGYFKNLFDAACARKSAEIKHDFHPNHGRR